MCLRVYEYEFVYKYIYKIYYMNYYSNNPIAIGLLFVRVSMRSSNTQV